MGQNDMSMGVSSVRLENCHESAVNQAARNTLTVITSSRSDVFTLIRLFVLAMIPFIVVDAAIYQVQMLVAGGRAPVTAAVLKLALLAVFAVAAIFRCRVTNSHLIRVGLLFLTYLVLDTLFFYFNLGIALFDILTSYNIYYLIFFIDLLALCIPLRISDRLLVGIVITCFLVCALLGYAQFLTQRPIVPTDSVDNNFRVVVWNSAAGIRAFSLFTAPGFFGLFSTMIAAMAVAMCGPRRNWLFGLPLLMLSVFACWISLTRSDLVGLGCALTTACVITFWGKENRARWLPLIYVPVGVLVGIYAFTLSSSGSGSGTRAITDTSSFTARIYEWAYYLGTFSMDKWPALLFGSGIIQSEKVQTNASIVPIDNLYLAIVLHSGLFGLGLTMALVWALWEWVRKKAESRASPLHTAVAASFSTLWCVGLFSVSAAVLGAMLLLCAVSKIDGEVPA
jgi:hypothetical protein